MNIIKLKIFVGFLLVHLINQVCCETNDLAELFKTGNDIILSVIIHENDTTEFFAKLDEEYCKSLDIFKDLNNKNIDDFIKLAETQTHRKVRIFIEEVNKFSVDEQFKYKDLVGSNAAVYKIPGISSDNCLKNTTLLYKILRCIDQHHNSQSTPNKNETEVYENMRGLLKSSNVALYRKIQDLKYIFQINTRIILSILKKNNLEFIHRKLNINIPPPLSSTKKDNLNVKYSISNDNDTLINLYVNQTNILNMADLENFVSNKLITWNVTLNLIFKVNNVDDKKNFQCCFDNFKVELVKAKNIATNKSNECVEIEKLNLENLVSSEIGEAKKHYPPCFYNGPRTLREIFGCMELHQSTNNAPKIIKTIYNQAVYTFNKNQQFLYNKIFNCSYETRNYFNQQSEYLNHQFDVCVRNQRPLEKCIEPTTHDSK